MNPSLIAILATVLLDAIGVGLVMPILPGLLRSLAGMGSTDTHYGVLLALYAFAQFLCAPLLGALSDRFGRRPVLLASLAGAALDYLLMAYAPTLAWLYAGRLIAGITGASVAVATAYVTDVTAEPDRARRFGQLGAVMGIGFIAGPLIGGLLGAWHLRAPFVAAALLNALNLALVWRALPESRPPSARDGHTATILNPFASLRLLRGGPALAALVGVYVIVALVSQAPATLWILYGQEHFGWSTLIAGLSLTGYGTCHALAQAFAIGPLIARLGERRALALGLAGDALGLVAIAFAAAAWVPFALLPLFAAGGLALPALQAMLARQVDDARQGELQGALASVASLIGVAGPLVVTATYAATRDTWPGLVWAAAALLYLLVPPLLFNARAARAGAAP
ncbi:Tet(A)/Tet(B)/Tet(C) family tetracycline efflux MFS transporter [Burkholderia stagnalis]|uniref:Tet(A)/Tet(B)/Tet(C) family tetracycline efflux MFS transporter n=1 Tax=Burkholderia stagnalis TaxID=1503054 RepID=UPI000F57DB0A|nr:Tet(A)/Tet(B)/Tet(C) family tetracycline efflux MFS transporter [Burkholderia stagnalis]RQQ15962.1 Tet(A)/Tet(B)/Tet(C) family tetracycline efflux MFS transporter [Burkholderia stagnalis]RQQ34706.1 Tet(A)/Tet(B)/Tet(C) family tetracycline efflux MFS transporter [Burkholderia stagnalis]RQQ38461.1 Tet(A)/Tet(B)/Tet(C) family tetracycline efflux MFS transporter [Burkholderia stagnalis]RQQ40002.1 Tet(A)/Tet(B)/Tet(C) family tetracycline efflux MFS transporter [Burkholderia stagnalis]RQQ53600.1 